MYFPASPRSPPETCQRLMQLTGGFSPPSRLIPPIRGYRPVFPPAVGLPRFSSFIWVGSPTNTRLVFLFFRHDGPLRLSAPLLPPALPEKSPSLDHLASFSRRRPPPAFPDPIPFLHPLPLLHSCIPPETPDPSQAFFPALFSCICIPAHRSSAPVPFSTLPIVGTGFPSPFLEDLLAVTPHHSYAKRPNPICTWSAVPSPSSLPSREH